MKIQFLRAALILGILFCTISVSSANAADDRANGKKEDAFHNYFDFFWFGEESGTRGDSAVGYLGYHFTAYEIKRVKFAGLGFMIGGNAYLTVPLSIRISHDERECHDRPGHKNWYFNVSYARNFSEKRNAVLFGFSVN